MLPSGSPRRKNITDLFLIFVLCVLLASLMSCKEEEVAPAEPYYYVDPLLEPYIEAYIEACHQYGASYVIPVSFSATITDQLGVQANTGPARVRTYPNGAKELQITDEMWSWRETSRRYIIFHELGHAFRNLKHQNKSYGIMAKYLYPSLEFYEGSEATREYMEERHFTEGL